MVLAIPAAAVIAGAVMLVLANATWDGLVADDYYQRGMEINRSLARDAEAARLGLEAAISFHAPGVVEARVSGVDGAAAALSGDRLNLRFARATRAGTDVEVVITRVAGATWRGTLPALPPGKWYVELGNEQWRLAAPVRIPVSSAEFVLHARPMDRPDSGLNPLSRDFCSQCPLEPSGLAPYSSPRRSRVNCRNSGLLHRLEYPTPGPELSCSRLNFQSTIV